MSGELSEVEPADFERYIRARIEAIRGGDPAAYRNHPTIAELKRTAREPGHAPSTGDLAPSAMVSLL